MSSEGDEGRSEVDVAKHPGYDEARFGALSQGGACRLFSSPASETAPLNLSATLVGYQVAVH